VEFAVGLDARSGEPSIAESDRGAGVGRVFRWCGGGVRRRASGSTLRVGWCDCTIGDRTKIGRTKGVAGGGGGVMGSNTDAHGGVGTESKDRRLRARRAMQTEAVFLRDGWSGRVVSQPGLSGREAGYCASVGGAEAAAAGGESNAAGSRVTSEHLRSVVRFGRDRDGGGWGSGTWECRYIQWGHVRVVAKDLGRERGGGR